MPWKLIVERFAHNALALLAVTTILFFMFRLMPGTPLAACINENLNADQRQRSSSSSASTADVAAILIYLGNLHGEMGLSFFQRRPVLNPVEVLPNSLMLRSVADHRLCLGVLAGAWLGWGAAAGSRRRGAGGATRAPRAWIGMVLLALLSLNSAGFLGRRQRQACLWRPGSASSDYLHHLALPCSPWLHLRACRC